jgi:pimeloyl-ACP methyl ester carboxylesterase
MMNTYTTPYIRTAETRFSNLPDFAFEPQYVALPSFPAMRMAYIDAPAANVSNGKIALCLHGEPSWSFLYRKMIPVLQAAGYRVIAPDLFGFGRSDKPVDPTWFQFLTHRQSLLEFVETLGLREILLIVQDWGGILGLTLPVVAPERYKQLLVLNTTLGTGDSGLTQGFKDWRTYMAAQANFDCAKLFARACPHLTQAELAAYNAPFENPESLAGVLRFPGLVPEFIDSQGAHESRLARQFWSNDWHGKSFMAIGALDPVLGPAVMNELRQRIRGCPQAMVVANGGHFLQEWQSLDHPIIQTALASFQN